MGREPDPRVTDLGYGCGEYHPETDLWDWYEDVPDVAHGGARRLSWTELFDQWALIEGAFAEVFHLDLEDELHRRTWRWFRVRLNHLISTDSALSRHFRDREQPEDA